MTLITRREAHDLLTTLFPQLHRVTREIATWHPTTDDVTGESAVRLTVTTWGLRDVVAQWGDTVPTLRDAWRRLAALGVVHHDRAGDRAAFRAWCQLGRR